MQVPYFETELLNLYKNFALSIHFSSRLSYIFHRVCPCKSLAHARLFTQCYFIINYIMTLTHHMKVNPVLPGPARFIMSRIPGFEMLGSRAIMVEKTVANSIMPHIKLKENWYFKLLFTCLRNVQLMLKTHAISKYILHCIILINVYTKSST